MKPDTWSRVRTILEEALELTGAEQQAFVARETGLDHELRAAVGRMLASSEPCPDFLGSERFGAQRGLPAPEVLTGLEAGQRIGAYRVIERIGSGGMGAVYAAEHEELGRRVALKLLPGGHASSSALRRFRDEVQMLARLRHPRIAQIYEAGSEELPGGAVPWFAMELVEDGRDLLTWADEEQADLDDRLRLFVQLCEAVAHGHGRGVLHRDLKPSNVLVDGEGRVRLIDFGIARALEGGADDSAAHTRTGWLIGTPQCMAPEQLTEDERDLDVRCDVYALGALLYQLTTGRPPHDLSGKSLAAMATILREQEPVRPSALVSGYPSDLEWVVLHALEKEPRLRYATVDALAEDLRRFRANEPVSVGPPTPWYRLRKFARRNRVLVAGGTALFVGLILAVVGTSLGLVRARVAEAEARSAARESELVSSLVQGIFEGVENTVEGRGLLVLDLLDAAAVDFEERAIEDPRVEFAFRSLLGETYYELDRFDAALIQLERSHALLDGLSLEDVGPEQRARLRMMLGGSEARAGAPERGRARLAAAIVEADATDSPELRLQSRLLRISLLLGAGLYDEALGHSEAVYDLAVQQGSVRGEELALGSLARCYARLGRFELATELYEDILARQEQRGGKQRDVADTLTSLASLYADLGDLERADEAMDRAVPILTELLGPAHDDTLGARATQAELAFRRGDLEGAGGLYREVVSGYEHRPAGVTTATLAALHNIGLCEHMQHRFVEAEPYFRRAVELGSELLDGDDLTLARYRLQLGVNLGWQTGRLEEAEPLLLDAFERIEALMPADHSIVTNAIDKVAIFYNINGEEDEANRWWDRLPPELDPRRRR